MTPHSGAALIILALVPLAISIVAATCSGVVVRRLRPASATVLLTVVALTVALVTGLLLCLGAVVALAEIPALSGLGHWSPDAVRATVPIHPLVGLSGAVVASLLLGCATTHLLRVGIRMRRTAAAVAAMPAVGDLTVVCDAAVFAYAVPGRHRRIVTSTGMLTTLSAAHRRVLLAHELAHLRHHHHLYVQLGRLAAAANPIMRPVSSAIELAVERWADEVAARQVGDRITTAQALATAALARPAGGHPAEALPGAQTDILDRVTSLIRPPARRPVVAVALVTAVIACWLSGGLVIGHVHGWMELAESVHSR